MVFSRGRAIDTIHRIRETLNGKLRRFTLRWPLAPRIAIVVVVAALLVARSSVWPAGRSGTVRTMAVIDEESQGGLVDSPTLSEMGDGTASRGNGPVWNDTEVSSAYVGSSHILDPRLIPPTFTAVDFTIPPAYHHLLHPPDTANLSTLGDRIRLFVRLHTRARALDAHEMRQTRHGRSHAGDFAEFRAFVHALERSLFPWLAGEHPTVASLYTTFARQPKSRGIVITAGSPHVRMLMVSIRSIRASGSTLPIEVAFAGPSDLYPRIQRKLRPFCARHGATLLDLFRRMDVGEVLDKGKGASWAVKPFVVLLSSFTEVLAQDADVVWLGKPDEVFMEPGYGSSGTVFYYDRRTILPSSDDTVDMLRSILPTNVRTPLSPHLGDNAMLAGLSAHHQESGVVAVDKSRAHNVAGLLGACTLNDRVHRGEVYAKVYGDKETFWMGWEMVGSTGMYAFSRWPATQIGLLVRGDQKLAAAVTDGRYISDPEEIDQRPFIRICSAQVAHLGPSGRSILWFNGGPFRTKKDESKGVFAPTHWAVEHYSKWSMGPSNMACLWLKKGANVTVDDEGNWVDEVGSGRVKIGRGSTAKDGQPLSSPVKPEKPGLDKIKDTHHGPDIGPTPVMYQKRRMGGALALLKRKPPPWFLGDLGDAVPRRLGKSEQRVVGKMEEWWQDACENVNDTT